MSVYARLRSLLEGQEAVRSVALGGSRARMDHTPESDYDLFCVVTREAFRRFREDLPTLIEISIPEVVFFVEVYYTEGSGYLFKGLDMAGLYYDVSLIPEHRIDEMGIRSTNVVLYDTNSLYHSMIEKANDLDTDPGHILESQSQNLTKIFLINLSRFITQSKAGDYWMMVRYLERLRNCLTRRLRTIAGKPPRTILAPERLFEDEIPTALKENYVIDGTRGTLIRSAQFIIAEYRETLDDDSLLLRTLAVVDKRGLLR